MYYAEADGAFDAPEEIREDEDVREIVFRLRHAGREHDLAWNLDLVLLRLERVAFGPKTATEIDPNDVERVLDALSRCAEAAFAKPPLGVSRDQVMHGLMVVRMGVLFWALPPEKRAASRKLARVLRQALRVFRNRLHDACLLENIAEVVSGPQALTPALIDGAVDIDTLAIPSGPLRDFTQVFSFVGGERHVG